MLNIQELTIPKGETFGLVGNNGAGKTTLFSLLLDLIEPSSGSIQIDGIQVNKSENWKNKVSAFIDDSFLIGYLTQKNIFTFRRVARTKQSFCRRISKTIRRFI